VAPRCYHGRLREHLYWGAFLLLLLAAPAQAEPGWLDTPFLRQVVARAQSEHRQVLVRVIEPWCEECDRLARELARPAVASRLGPLLRVSYDARAGEGRDVARRYNVVAFPTLLVLGSDGMEIGRITGLLPVSELTRRLDQLRGRRQTLQALEREADRKPDRLELQLRVGIARAARGDAQRAEQHLSRVVKGDPDNRQGLAAPALLALGDLLFLRSLRRNADAERTLSSLVKQHGSSAEAARALLPLARALARQGRTARAVEIARRAAARATAVADHVALARFCLEEQVARELGLGHARRAVVLSAGRTDLRGLVRRLEGDVQNSRRVR